MSNVARQLCQVTYFHWSTRVAIPSSFHLPSRSPHTVCSYDSMYINSPSTDCNSRFYPLTVSACVHIWFSLFSSLSSLHSDSGTTERKTERTSCFSRPVEC